MPVQSENSWLIIKRTQIALCCLVALFTACPSSSLSAADQSNDSETAVNAAGGIESSTDAALGQRLYAEKCAYCHGDVGEGTDAYKIPLTGDRSVLELSRVIASTMPEDSDEKCSQAESEAIAAYMHSEFYSILAQERNRPAKVEFSRLTVRQYENSVIDLLGSFRWEMPIPTENGMKGVYYDRRFFDNNKKVLERVDPQLLHHFGENRPEGFPPEKEKEELAFDDIREPNEFSVIWTGSLFVPESGDYEFTVETENGVKLYVNSWRDPIIDAWVRSPDDRIFKGSIRLTGGRRYIFKVDYFRFNEPTASLKVSWKRPGRAVEEVIPSEYLSPAGAPESFVLTTPFPPDDRSIGYERGSSISKEWKDAVTMAALETAQYITDHFRPLAGLKPEMSVDENEAKIHDFCLKFVERAFRRPLTDEEIQTHVRAPRVDQPEEIGVKRVVLMALLSPNFLYREVGLGDFNDHSVASWLSYTLWDSMPDGALRDAANNGQLQTQEQIRAQVDRMVVNQRFHNKLNEFYLKWLRLDHVHELVKSSEVFGDFTPEVAADLRESLELAVREFAVNPAADFRQFLLDEQVYLNPRLAKFYGAPIPDSDHFVKTPMGNQGRHGVISHPMMMAGFAYHVDSSPIHRGVFLSRSVLGRRLKPPPEAVSPLTPDLHAEMTTRDRVALQTSAATCMSCHVMINDLGFTLENFDAVGRFRELDKNQSIDNTGSYLDRQGHLTEFAGSHGLSEFLAHSPEVHEAFTEQLFQFVIKQPVRAFGQDELQTLAGEFKNHEFNVQELAKQMVCRTTATLQAEQERRTAEREGQKLSSTSSPKD